MLLAGIFAALGGDKRESSCGHIWSFLHTWSLHFGSNFSADDMLHQNRRATGRSINMFDFVLKGANASQLEKDIGSDLFPANEHFFGLVNVSFLLLRDLELNHECFYFQFGNTCYSNSVLQALYFCKPFREKVLEYKAKNKKGKETLLSCLADLFYSIATQKKKVGTIAPKKFIARLRKEKGTCVNSAESQSFFALFSHWRKTFFFSFSGFWQLHATRCPRVSQLPHQSHQRNHCL